MLKQPAVAGRTLTLSEQDPASAVLTFTLTPVDDTAQRTTAEGKSLVIKQIQIEATCSGQIDSDTFAGKGSATISAASPRVTCEGQELVLEGANVVLTCNGTRTDPSGNTKAGKASVRVTVSDAGQTSVEADDA
jgi:hypothetical protein